MTDAQKVEAFDAIKDIVDSVEVTPIVDVPQADFAKVGGVLKAPGMVDASSEAQLLVKFNELLKQLRESGVMGLVSIN